MASLLLQVSYRVHSQHVEQFEHLLTSEVLPLAGRLGLEPTGIWKTLAGKAGEYYEHWEFSSAEDFHLKWRSLMEHPRFREIVRITGAMVENEVFTLLEPLNLQRSSPEPGGGRQRLDR